MNGSNYLDDLGDWVNSDNHQGESITLATLLGLNGLNNLDDSNDMSESTELNISNGLNGANGLDERHGHLNGHSNGHSNGVNGSSNSSSPHSPNSPNNVVGEDGVGAPNGINAPNGVNGPSDASAPHNNRILPHPSQPRGHLSLRSELIRIPGLYFDDEATWEEYRRGATIFLGPFNPQYDRYDDLAGHAMYYRLCAFFLTCVRGLLVLDGSNVTPDRFWTWVFHRVAERPLGPLGPLDDFGGRDVMRWCILIMKARRRVLNITQVEPFYDTHTERWLRNQAESLIWTFQSLIDSTSAVLGILPGPTASVGREVDHPSRGIWL